MIRSSSPLRVGSIPLDSGDNPYLSLLYEAIRRDGVAFELADIRPWRLRPSSCGYSVLHVHWPEYVMAGTGKGAAHVARATLAASAFRSAVRRLQRRHIRLVWTVHNIRPHDVPAPQAQLALYSWLAEAADAAIVHTAFAGHLVRDKLGRTGPGYLARHGNFIDVYPPPTESRRALRERYGFGDHDDVILVFGQMRRYKGLRELTEDFMEAAPRSARLLLAGSPTDRALVTELEALAAQDDRVVIDARRVPDSEVSGL